MHQLALHELSHVYGQTKQHAQSHAAEGLGIMLILPELFTFTSFSMYTKAIEETLIDGIISMSRWIKFVNKLCVEQGKYMLIATVLLAANLALLAIPDISKLNIVKGFSKASIFSSLACIASGFPLMQLHWSNAQPQFNSVSQYWCFVFMCSLPVTALSHAFVYFCYGIIFMVVDNHYSKLAVILIAGILGIFVVCLFMALSSFIFKEPKSSRWQPLPARDVVGV